MLLGSLLKSIKGSYKAIPIKGIAFDSRIVKRNDIFFAIEGSKTSGSKYINDAVRKGASLIVSNKRSN